MGGAAARVRDCRLNVRFCIGIVNRVHGLSVARFRQVDDQLQTSQHTQF
jgi:hypothetical protein